MAATAATVYFEEITSDDEGPDTHHDGEEVEVLPTVGGDTPFDGSSPFGEVMPIHTLTSDMVADYKEGKAAAAAAPAAPPTAPPPAPPSNPESEAIRFRGNAAFGAKKFDEAVSLYGEAIALDKENGLLYGNRSAALLQLGKAPAAVADAREMVRLLPTLAKAHFRLGSALAASSQPADAARSLAAALKLEPSNESIADALRKELGRPSLKKGKQHAPLVQECNAVLATAKVPANPSKADARVYDAKGVLVFGGQDPRSSKLLADLSLLRVPTRCGLDASWTSLLTTRGGEKPAARNGHSWTADPEGGACLLFGGADDEGHRNDVWRLSLGDGLGSVPSGTGEGESSPEWKAVNCTGVPPAPREMHVAEVLPTRRKLLVHGGRSNDEILNDGRVLCLATWVWTNPLVSPCRRVGHACAFLPAALSAKASSAKLVLFGGFTGEGFANDVWTVTPDAVVRGEAASFTQAATRGAPQMRFAHCCAAIGDRLFVFGGSGAAAELDDLFEVRLQTP